MAIKNVNEKPSKISLKKLYYALMTDEQNETYSEDIKVLEMPISLTQTPNFSEASLDAGDRVVDQEAQLDSVTIAGETADLPIEVQADWFGHKLSSAGGLIVNSNDTPRFLAIGYESGSKLVWFFKAKFKPGEEAANTRKKGETTYKTYPFSGEALPLSTGNIKHVVDTRNEGVTETPETFFASVQMPEEKTTVPTP
ncbi:major tail protein [Lysinibacillus fusiformis]|uniref:major tail protein n=1 Tax=Lysinibacillus fusiformis TaxID=28031 RepID=UPI002D766330|nr:major tail protein [Lysinibacillus fusiformis]WRS99938.1 major tail protein [Lysinibacillus fusiformis]